MTTTEASSGVIKDASITNTKLNKSSVNGQSDTVITADDEILFSDASDSNNLKKDTVQGILDLFGATGLVTLQSQTAAASAQIDFVNGTGGAVIDSTHRVNEIELTDFVPAADGDIFWILTSTDGGSTFDTGASDYEYTSTSHVSSAAGSVDDESTGAAQIAISSLGCGSAAGEGLSGKITIYNPAGTTVHTKIHFRLAYEDTSGNIVRVEGWGKRKSTGDVDAIRLKFSTGNIASGIADLNGKSKP